MTKTPSQAKYLIQKKSYEKSEEMKHSEEMELDEQKRLSKTISKKDSRCLIYRLKLFAHVLLLKKGTSNLSPFRALTELNHRIISENDSFLLGTNQSKPQQVGPPAFYNFPPGHGGPGGFGSIFSQGHPGAYGDYEHCISALRQLQKPITVSLIYDPKKNLQHDERRAALENYESFHNLPKGSATIK